MFEEKKALSLIIANTNFSDKYHISQEISDFMADMVVNYASAMEKEIDYNYASGSERMRCNSVCVCTPNREPLANISLPYGASHFQLQLYNNSPEYNSTRILPITIYDDKYVEGYMYFPNNGMLKIPGYSFRRKDVPGVIEYYNCDSLQKAEIFMHKELNESIMTCLNYVQPDEIFDFNNKEEFITSFKEAIQSVKNKEAKQI